MIHRAVALLAVSAVLALGPACAQKNEDKQALLELLARSGHQTGVFRYSDETPTSPLGKGNLVQVRGLIEDDFRYKARLTVDGNDVLDEVVNDDALAVRFLDPAFIPTFTSSTGGSSDIRAALAARTWVADPTGAPSIGDAAVSDRILGLDPIVDSLSVVDYVRDAISAAVGVQKYNAERLDYRPNEDPFPKPAGGSGVVRWDLVAPPMPRADAAQTGQGNAALARAPVFRQMAVYVKDGEVVQIREFLGARFDLLDRFRSYIIRLLEDIGGEANLDLKRQVEAMEEGSEELESFLLFILNIALQQAGEDPIRFRTMKYEFDRPEQPVKADLPRGTEIVRGSLEFFGVNSKLAAQRQRTQVAEDLNSLFPDTTTTTAP